MKFVPENVSYHPPRRTKGKMRPFKVYMTDDTAHVRGVRQSVWVEWRWWASYCTMHKAHVAAVLLLARSSYLTAVRVVMAGVTEVALWRPRKGHRPPKAYRVRPEGYTKITSAGQAARIVAYLLDEEARVRTRGGR